MTVMDPEKTFETWTITTQGRVWLQTTSFNRFNQPMLKDVSVGPNRPGAKLKITVADREMNQDRVVDPALDPFRNGLLVRVDGDQNTVAETASTDALSTQDLLKLFTKSGNAFQSAVKSLGEIPIRRMRELAPEVDATAKQLQFLDDLIAERYFRGRSQEDAVFDLAGERRSERERDTE